MSKISPQLRKQLDSLTATSAGKELVSIYSDRLCELLNGLLMTDPSKLEAVRSEALGLLFTLRTLVGKKVVLKISFED
jgi:hypothetical protein